MRRLPPPWLSEDTASDRSAAHAIGMPILRVYQLQPRGCTQLHHLNEAMLFRAAARASSSWSHRRAPTYLRRSHMPPDCTYTNTSLSQSNPRSQAVARRSKRGQKGTELTIAGIAANELQGISAAAFCYDALSRPPVEPTS